MDHLLPEAFRNLFYEHYPSVRRKLALLVRNETSADDLAQEVFIRLYRNPPEDLATAGAWLHRVLTRVGYDYLRGRQRETRLLEKQARLAPEEAIPSHEQAVLDKMDRESVRDLLDGFSERDRQALLLRYSGFSYDEIAEQLNVRRPTVGTLLNRAAGRLKLRGKMP